MAVIGIDVGGTTLKGALVSEEGRVLAGCRRATPRDAPRLAAAIEEMVDELDPPRRAAAAGIGIAATVLQPEGRPLDANNIPIGPEIAAGPLSERLGMAVVIDNDGNAAAIAEHRLGVGRGHDDVVVVVLGTGVGGGAIVGGALMRGGRGLGAEPGHMVVDADGPECPSTCTNRGCLEAFAGANALRIATLAAARTDPTGAIAARLAAGDAPGPPLLGALAAAGELAATDILDRAGRMLGVGLSSLANLFAPVVIAVGGGVAGLGDALLDPAREEYRARVLPPHADVPIVPAGLGPEAGTIGAALLALDHVGEGAWVA